MIGAIEESQITMAGHIANLVRSDYERQAIQPSKRLIRSRLAMVTATVIHAGRWNSEALRGEYATAGYRRRTHQPSAS